MSFAEDYGSARTDFLEAAERAGARLLRVRVPAEGCPDLFIDFALLKRDPASALLHFCGVHGIEGYLGSAVQSALLSQLPEKGPSLLFVHAVNPYGMNFYRRANSENVDLNRNFAGAPAVNPEYRFFEGFLHPASPAGFLTSIPGLLWTLARLGSVRTNQAVAGGQSGFPRGLFFAGKNVQRELLLVRDFLRSHFSGVNRVAALDLHTGLGRRGEELLFADSDREPASGSFFASACGRPVDTPDPAGGTYKIHGRFSDLIRSALPAAELRYALQEIGTQSKLAVLHALRRENFEWHRRPPDAFPSDRVRRGMLEAFVPRDPAWRARALELGTQRWRETHQALQEGRW